MFLNKSGIYLIRNCISGRVYVGSAVKIRQRWAEHRSMLQRGKHHSPILQNSWAKHGAEAFSFEILEIVEDITSLILREQYWIDLYGSANPDKGFNLNPMAASSLGKKRTPETIAKIQASRKNYVVSDETRAKMSASGKGKKKPPFTPAHCAAISAAKKGRGGWINGPLDDVRKAKISKANTGRKASAETIAKMSAARLGRKRPPFTDLHKARISEGKKRMFALKRDLAKAKSPELEL